MYEPETRKPRLAAARRPEGSACAPRSQAGKVDPCEGHGDRLFRPSQRQKRPGDPGLIPIRFTPRAREHGGLATLWGSSDLGQGSRKEGSRRAKRAGGINTESLQRGSRSTKV